MDAARSYLDHNATTPIRPEVVEACARALELSGNPSSVHVEGRAARAAIEIAREQVASLVGARPKQVVFTSGGTEASATVLSPSLARVGSAEVRPARLLIGAAEHACGLDGHRFRQDAVERIPVNTDGIVDLTALDAALRASKDHRILVSLQVANNETGVVQPVRPAAALARAAGALLHCDAVQAAGKVPLDLAATGADALTLSAHKLGGPKGVGAIVLADGVELTDRLVRGGGQERGLRAGTENVVGIVGFGVAAMIAARDLASEATRLGRLRERIEAAILAVAPEAVIFGRSVERLPNTTCFAVPGLKAETALIALDLDGVAASSGAACSSGKVRRSHVLDAMGMPSHLAEGAIRVSLGWNSGENDVNRFASAFERLVRALYKRRAVAA